MSKSLRRSVWMLVVAVVVAAAWWLLRPSPVPIETARVDRGRVEQSIEEDGETRVRDRYTIAAPVTGRLQRVTLRAGDAVEVGQVVAVIEPAPLDSRAYQEGVARLDAAVDAEKVARTVHESAQETLAQTERERDRALRLGQQGVIAQETRERAELAVSTARKDLDAAALRARVASHNVELARAAIAARSPGDGVMRLRAPVAGWVLCCVEESERVVQAGTPVLEIGDIRTLDVVVDLLSNDAVNVSPGDTLEVRDWGGDSTLVARVRLVEPSGFTKISALGVEEQRVNVVATLTQPPLQLGDRFRVGVRILLWRGNDVRRVPRGAVFQIGDEWAAYEVKGGRAHERRLDIGHRGDEYAEILGGIDEGAVVVMYPDERIRSGVRVAESGPR